MKYLSIVLLLLFSNKLSIAQKENHYDYIKANSSSFDIDDIKLKLPEAVHNQDVVFFGFIHGSATPQLVDFELLKHFAQNGRRYYAPEVSQSMAFFLNQYLTSGRSEILDFVLYFYKRRVPQDASIQFREKWQKIYQFNKAQSQEKKIIVIGTDIPLSDKRLAITHLAHLLPEGTAGHPMIDSLKQYRNFEIDDRLIWSGKPVLERAISTKKPVYDFVYPLQSRYHFAKRFFEFFQQKENGQFLKNFKTNQEEAQKILEVNAKKREQYISESLGKIMISLLEKNEKVYINYGYAHIQQAKVNDRLFLAGLLKAAHPELKVYSMLGLLAKSNTLKNEKLIKTGNAIFERGVQFEEAQRVGYKSSKSYDGDGLFERVKGIKWLMRASQKKDVLIIDLNQKHSPFHEGNYFAAYKRGGKHWRLEADKGTTDYFQYVIYMQHSESNIPFVYDRIGSK